MKLPTVTLVLICGQVLVLTSGDLTLNHEASLPRDLPRASSLTGKRHGGVPITHGKCEPITIPLCANIKYNETIVPNLLGRLIIKKLVMGSIYIPKLLIGCSTQRQDFFGSQQQYVWTTHTQNELHEAKNRET